VKWEGNKKGRPCSRWVEKNIYIHTYIYEVLEDAIGKPKQQIMRNGRDF
jgi:hypothetical protein